MYTLTVDSVLYEVHVIALHVLQRGLRGVYEVHVIALHVLQRGLGGLTVPSRVVSAGWRWRRPALLPFVRSPLPLALARFRQVSRGRAAAAYDRRC